MELVNIFHYLCEGTDDELLDLFTYLFINLADTHWVCILHRTGLGTKVLI